MKKIIASFIFLSLIFSNFSVFPIKASEEISVNKIDEIKEQVTYLNDASSSISIVEARYLYDINNQPTYILSITKENGYIISNAENSAISEYSLIQNSNPYKDYSSSRLYYYGSMNYSDQKITNQSENTSLYSINDDISSIQKQNDIFLNEVKPVSINTRASSSWVGADKNRFKRYNGSSWINKTNICGPVSAAIMLAYYDDYLGYDVISDSVRKKNSSSPGTLITKLVKETPRATATIPGNVAVGIKGFMSKYSPDKRLKPRSSAGASPFSSVKSDCSSKHPICVGLLGGLGSTYGDHWVTVYQVKETAPYMGYYMCIDNQGNYQKQISSSWAIGAVTLRY